MITISYNEARPSTDHAFSMVRHLPEELGVPFVTYVTVPFWTFSRLSLSYRTITITSPSSRTLKKHKRRR